MPISGNSSNTVNVFTSGSLTTPLPVTSTQANPVYVTGAVDVTISPIVSIEGSVAPTGSAAPLSATLVGAKNDAGNLVPLTASNLGVLYVAISSTGVPLGVTGTVGVVGTVAVSQTNQPLTQSVWVANSQGSDVNITASVPLQVTASIPNLTASISNFPAAVTQVTASISNLPVTQSVWVANAQGSDVNITASIPLQVTASVPNLTASISNFPAAVTQVTASISNFPTGFNANITGSITLPVTMSTGPAAAIWVTGSTGGTSQVTASVPNLTASISNFPVTQSVVANITASIPLQVSASIPAGVSITNFPVTQSVIANISQSIPLQVTASVTFPVTQSVVANVTQSVPFNVTATLANPVRVTGVVETSFNDPAEGVVDGSAPSYAMLVGNKSAGGFFRAWRGEADGTGWVTGTVTLDGVSQVSQSTNAASAIWVTGNFATTGPVTQSVVANITQSIPLNVTATAANPVWVVVSGNMSATFTGTMNVTATVANPAQITGTVHVDNTSFGVTFVSQSVTGTVSVGNVVTVTSSLTNPVRVTGAVEVATHAVTFVSQSVTGTVSIGNVIPTHGVTFVSQSVTGTVSVGNIVPVTMSTAAASAIWVTGTVAANITASISSQNASLGGTGSVAPFTATLIGGKNDAGNLQVLSATTDGRLWVTGNFGSLSTPATQSVVANITQSIPLTVTATQAAPLWVAISGNLTATFSGVLGITSTIAEPLYIAGPASGSSSGTNLSQSLNTIAANYGYSDTLGLFRPIRAEGTNGDGEAVIDASLSGSALILSTEAYNKNFNGSTWDRQRGDISGTWIKTVSGTVLSTNTPDVVTNSGTLTALNSAVTVALNGALGVGVYFVVSTLAGNVTPEYSIDGVTWFQGSWVAQGTTYNSPGTTAQLFSFPDNPGYGYFRIRVGVYTSGNATVNVRLTKDSVIKPVASYITANPLQLIANTTGSYVSLTSDVNAQLRTVTSISSSIALPVTFTSQSITGTVSVGNVLPTHGVTFVSQSVTGTVSVGNSPTVLFVSQSVTGTVSIGNTIPTHGVTFVSQSVTGTVSVGNIVAVSQSTVPASAIWITGTVATVGGGSAVTFVSQSVTGTVSVGNVVTVTSSVTNPIQITGTIHYDNASSGGGTQYGTGSIVAYTGTLALYAQESDNSAVAAKTDTNHVLLVNMVSGTIPAASNPTVAGTGSAAPFSASLVGLKDDAGNIRPLSGSSNGVLYVAISGAIDAVFSGTQIVTSTVAAPVWITGTSHFDNTSIATTFVSQSVTGTVSVGNVVSVTATVANPVQITGTTHFDNTSIAVTFVSQSITGTVSIGNTHPVTFISQSVTGTISIGNVIPTHGVTFISQSVTGAISITNTPAVTFVSQSVTGTISIGNVIATHGVTFVSQSVTGTVSIGNTAAVTSTFANPVWVITRPQIVTTPTIAVVTASSTSQQLFAANANRIGVTIQNFAASNAIFVNLNTSEARFNSATVRIAGNGYWEMPFRYTGSIQIAASGAQTAIAIGQEFFG